MLHTTAIITLTLFAYQNDAITQKCKDSVELFYNERIQSIPNIDTESFKKLQKEAEISFSKCINSEFSRGNTNAALVRVISSNLTHIHVKPR